MATLNDLRSYLQHHQAVPMTEMAQHFHKDPAVLRDMLEHWIRKGKVRISPMMGNCKGGCAGCTSANRQEICCWIDQQATRNPT